MTERGAADNESHKGNRRKLGAEKREVESAKLGDGRRSVVRGKNEPVACATNNEYSQAGEEPHADDGSNDRTTALNGWCHCHSG